MIRKAISLLLLSSIVGISPALSAEPLFTTYLEAGNKARKANNTPEAVRMYELAIKNSEHLKPDDKVLADLYDSLGNSLANAGKVQQSEEYLLKALKLHEAAEPKDELLIYKSLIFLGTLYRDQSRFAEAEKLYQKAMTTNVRPGKMGILFQATTLTALASLYIQMSRPVEAETLLRKSIAMREGLASPSDTTYDALARALDAQEKYKEATEYYRKALAMAEKDSGPDTIAISQANLASSLSGQGKYTEARTLLNAALKTAEKNRGLKSPLTATCYSNLAALAINEDQYAEAETLLNKALSIHEQVLGPECSSAAFDLIKLMSVYRNQGQYTKAQETGERAIAIFKKTLGPDAIETAKAMSQLADLYNNQLRFDDAKKLADEVVRIMSERLGADSIEYGIGLLLTAEVDNAKHKTTDAISTMQKAEEILTANKNSEAGLIARVDEELSEYLQADKKFAEAERSMKKCIGIREKLWGTESPRLVPNLNTLVELYDSQKKAPQAQAVRDRIAKIRQVTPGLPRTLFDRSTAPADSPILNGAQPVKDKWLLAVGISNFANPALNLKYAAKDAVDFSNFLIHDESFSPDHVKVLTDKAATREGIIDALGKGWLGKKANADDLVVVYVSSHGSTARDDAGGTNFLVAHDTDANALLSTGIPMQWLSKMIKEQVHSDRVVLIMDVCHSGSVSGDPTRTITSAKTEPQIASADASGAKGIEGQKGLKRALPQMNVEDLEAGSGQAIICSSSSDQNSWESKKYSNSVFTRQLIESMQKEGPKANLDMLFAAMRKNVENEVLQDRGAVQTPVIYNKNWAGPSPVLSEKTSPAVIGSTTEKQ